jgi:hypothetical protein
MSGERSFQVRMTEAEWQAVIAILGSAPFNQVAPLIRVIMQQIKPQQQQGEDS